MTLLELEGLAASLREAWCVGYTDHRDKDGDSALIEYPEGAPPGIARACGDFERHVFRQMDSYGDWIAHAVKVAERMGGE